MNWRLPPLNALRAFEAAARYESFSLAATELNVTAGAISRQIQSLEAFLGYKLFIRNNREVKLTAESREFSLALAQSFLSLDVATRKFVESRRNEPLRVACSMVVATRWLFPRLARYHAQYPQRHVSVTTMLSSPQSLFSSTNIDAVICLGTDDWPSNAKAAQLFKSELVVICSPDLCDGRPPISKPDDLASYLILTSALRPQSWKRWIQASGARGIDLDRAQEFESSALTYSAALQGHGVALGERAFIGDDVQQGRLTIPLPQVLRNPESFHVAYRRDADGDPKLAEFIAWLLREAKESARLTDEIAEIPRYQS